MGNSNSTLSTSAMTESTQSQEEIIIMSSVTEMAKHFLRENVIIWHDPNVHSPENTAYVAELKNICDIQVFVDWKEASDCLKKETQLSCCQVITSGTNGELFVKEISCLPFISSIYVFCGSISYHKTWASQYSKVVCVEDRFLTVLDKIKQSMITWQRTSSSLRVDLPSFAPIFDDMDLNEMNNLQFYLQGLINFQNRPQAKKNFLDLAKALYGKNKHIEEFDKKYDQYDMKMVLNWYTKECFLYRLTNNCLRIAKPDSIQYCRLLLKDLETAIKDKYRQTSHKFSGLLYRGAYLSDDEWTRLQQNCGREIEMHGFLSTTKQKKVAFDFCKIDLNKKAMITIVVPNFPDRGEQGFAEMREYTDFPGEDEVLFNVRSRFTVLEATIEEINGIKMRHLVLLYGAQAMRRYTTHHNPSIEVQISITQTTKCNDCNKKIQVSLGEGSTIAVNIYENQKYLCEACIKRSYQTNKLVLLCFSPLAYSLLLSSSSEKNKAINFKVEGIVMRYQESLNLPFYGDQCVVCQREKLNCCYRCVDCKEAKMIYCNNCFHDQNINSCLREGHMMIAQGYSFCFWSDKMSKREENYHNSYKEDFEQTSHLFQQANIFYNTKNYEKAIEYFQKYIEKHGDLKNEDTASSYNNLGLSYDSLGEYQKAREYHSKCLELCKTVFGIDHFCTSESYNNLGSVYGELEEHQKAIEHYSKSLEIRKILFGDNHPKIATSYNNLGGTYNSLGEYQKAIEYYSKALEIRRALLGDNHQDTASSYSQLGLTYKTLGEYQKAIECHSTSLEIRKTVLGNNHPDTANSYSNLGAVYKGLEEYQKAIEYYSKSLEVRKVVYGDDHPKTAASYNSLGGTYDSLGEYQKAIEYHSKSLEIRKAGLGDNHPDTANSYIWLGGTYDNLGEYQKAVEYFSKSLEIRKAKFGDNHPDTANSYSWLGGEYYNLGEYQKALECHSKCLEIRKAVSGDNHPDTATSYSWLGGEYYNLGEYRKAIQYHSKSLEIHKAVFRDNHRETVSSYLWLALEHDKLGEYQKAVEYYSKSLEIYKVILRNNNNPSTATSYSDLGIVYNGLKEYQRAMEYHYKSLEIRKTVLGNNHSDTASSYSYLGSAYGKLREYQKAIECHSKSLEIKKEVLGNTHHKTAASYNNLGQTYTKLREYQKAIEYHSKSLEINKVVFGDNHPETAISYNGLGTAYYNLGEYQKAIECHSKSLEIRRVVLGNNHPKTAASYNNLGQAYEKLREYQRAIEYYSKSLEIRKAVFGDNHPKTAASYKNLEVAKQVSKNFPNNFLFYA